jgi:hypothetical protein
MKRLIYAFFLAFVVLITFLTSCGDWGCDPGDVSLSGNCVSICNEYGDWETACF